MRRHQPTRPGRAWAYLGAVVGGTVSLVANVAHSYVPPADAPADWRPETGAVLSAAFWPVAVFVAVEILVRVDWPGGRPWQAARYLGLLPVTLVAAVVSYRHLSGLLHHYHEDALTALIGPVAVDGLMVMATAALLATNRTAPAGTPRDPVVVADAVRRQASLDAPPATASVLPERANGHAIGLGVAR